MCRRPEFLHVAFDNSNGFRILNVKRKAKTSEKSLNSLKQDSCKESYSESVLIFSKHSNVNVCKDTAMLTH